LMDPFSVVVLPEVCEFSLEVLSIPKAGVIKIFTANSPDKSLNEGVRYRHIRNGLDLIYTKNSQVRLPLVI
jgi:hypothetical protein